MYIHGREHEVKQMGSFIQYIYFDKYSLHIWQRGSIMGDEWFVGGVVPPPYLFSVEI